ncbi:MAG TPA: response regulator [Anaerolineales bacterium]|jgi:signal transduction histidine kinase|nr:response regulator [Anaerolineales bacterium]HQX01839.1 response regulator [Anaerolineales bacterium]
MTSKILIVDDDPLAFITMESIFDGQPYQLIPAYSGPSALEKAGEIMPDLILLDVMMPDMDGFEICRRIRSTPRLAEVPIIILTSLDDRSSRLLGIEAGADDFISKPPDRQELRLRVHTILRLNRYRTLHTQRENLRHMASHVIRAQEDERRRLSREIHDDLGQALIAHVLSLRSLQVEIPMQNELLKNRLDDLIADTNETINKMRQIAQDIRPAVLDTLGLCAALQTYSREFSLRTGLPVVFEADLEIPELSDTYSITLYRILQEALTNVYKHSMANQVWVELTIDDRNIVLTIQDNGVGFSLESRQKLPNDGIGVIGMQERMTLVGGQLLIKSSQSKGTIISAHLPLDEYLQIRE